MRKCFAIFVLLILHFSPISAEKPYMPGEILVLVSPSPMRLGQSSSVSDGLYQLVPKSIQKQIKGIKPTTFFKAPINIQGLGSISIQTLSLYQIDLENEADIPAVCEAFRTNSAVKIAQPNYQYEFTFTPDDPLFRNQAYLSALEMPKAWDYTRGNSGAIVAVIDTGIVYTHPDLQNNIWENPNEIEDGIDNDNNGLIDDIRGWDFNGNDNNPMDYHGHGTHVAGIVSAETNNTIGIASIGSKIKVMPLKATTNSGSYTTSAAIFNSIAYAVSKGAAIINMSFAGQSEDPLLESAFESAYDAGVLLVGAAGNDKQRINTTDNFYTPGSYPQVLTVAGTNNLDSPYINSNFGSVITLSAPGVNILSTWKSGYAYLSGTSMATPVISGMAAVLKSIKPDLTRDELVNILTANVYDLGLPGWDEHYGYGVPNLSEAILKLETAPLTYAHTPPAHLFVGENNILTFTISNGLFTSEYPIATITYQTKRDGNPVITETTASMNKSGTLYTIDLPETISGNRLDYYINVTALNAVYNQRFPESGVYTVPLIDLSGPQILATFAKNNDYLDQNSKLTFTIKDVSTVSANSIRININSSNQENSSLAITDQGITWQSPSLEINFSELNFEVNQNTEIEIAAQDDLGNESIVSFNFKVSAIGDLLRRADGSQSAPYSAPNPFNPETESTFLCFQLTESAEITYHIYSLSYQKIFQYSRRLGAGYHEIEWNGKNRSGNTIPNGPYLFVLEAKSDNKTIRKTGKILALR